MRRRLQQAALELYRERGYDRTTAAEIAARAGVTERTFFRHFPDKREVLFDGEAAFHAALSAAIAQAPETLGPMEVLLSAFGTIEKTLEDNRPFNEPAHEVIARTPALQERQLAKAASTTAAVAAALQRRGVELEPGDLGGRDRHGLVRPRGARLVRGPLAQPGDPSGARVSGPAWIVGPRLAGAPLIHGRSGPRRRLALSGLLQRQIGPWTWAAPCHHLRQTPV